MVEESESRDHSDHHQDREIVSVESKRMAVLS